MTVTSPKHAREAVLRRNNVLVQGRERGKPALVFVNGFGCEQSMWRSIAPQFTSSRRVVMFDHAGTGRPQRCAFDPARYASLHGYADDLLAVCDAADVSDAVLVAHSAGAVMAILAAIRWPAAFSQLILIGPSPCFLNDGSYLGGFDREDLAALLDASDADFPHWAHQMAPLIMGHPQRPELALELESSFNRTEPVIAKQFARVCFTIDHRADLGLLGTPTVILQSADDNIVPEVVGEYLLDTMADCQLIQLDATGHCPHLSAPAEVTAVLRGLLEERWIATEPAHLGSEL